MVSRAAVRRRRGLTVLQVLPELESGGVERGTLEVARALVQAGHRSLVMSAGGRLVEQLVAEGSEHFAWPVGRKSLWTLRLVPRLRRFLAVQGVDILHLRSRMPGWIAWLAWRSMDPASRPRLVTTVHGLYSVNGYSAVMTKGERVIAVSETVRNYILYHYPQVDPTRIELIYRGVAPEEFPHGLVPAPDWLAEWRQQYPQLSGRQLLTLPGRLTRLKGHEAFIELISRLRAEGLPVHGLIVGGVHPKKEAYLRELQETIATAGLAADITFTGQRGDLREIMAVSTIVLSLSGQPESFGRTVLEALSLGRPVVGYNHGGVGEILRRLFPTGCIELGDMNGLHATVKTLLAAPPAVDPVTAFSRQAMLDATLKLYEDLHAGHRDGTP